MDNHNFAPIALFVYNRLNNTQLTVSALEKNFIASKCELFIFSDGPKNMKDKIEVEAVRSYLKSIKGFKKVTIYKSIENKGLAQSIITGISQILSNHTKVIVLEDDLITTPNFLNFMNLALSKYENITSIQSVNGYSLKINYPDSNSDVFFHQRTFPWGWATWANRWNLEIFDKKIIRKKLNKNLIKKFNNKCGQDIGNMLLDSLSGKNNSWYVRWVFNHFLNNNLSVFPKTSKVINIGHTPSGTHCHGINTYVCDIDSTHNVTFNFSEVHSNKKITKEFLRYFTFRYKIFYRLKLIFKKGGFNLLINEIQLRFKK